MSFLNENRLLSTRLLSQNTFYSINGNNLTIILPENTITFYLDFRLLEDLKTTQFTC